MNSTITLKIATPSNFVQDDQILSVTINGEEGEFTVLPGHEALISSLRAGIVVVNKLQSSLKYFINNGMACVNDKTVEIITDFIVNVEQTNKTEIKEKILLLKNQLLNDPNNENKIINDIDKYELLMNYLL